MINGVGEVFARDCALQAQNSFVNLLRLKYELFRNFHQLLILSEYLKLIYLLMCY